MHAKRFTFGPYRADWEAGKLEFDYAFDNGLNFTERIQIPPSPPLSRGEVVEEIMRNLSLILGISYYKLYATRNVEVPFNLSEKQAAFWNAIYRKGLGEFWYRNRLEPAAPFHPSVPLARGTSPSKGEERRRGEGVLLGIGGGKDSLVAFELFKKELGARPPTGGVTAFVVETQKSSPMVDALIDMMGVPSLKIKRFLDEKLFGEHPGSYNGHVPISAVYAWLGILCAELYGFSWVAVGNEYSSNFGNIVYNGMEINHQWSKSSEFEAMFQDYVRNFVTPSVMYFSPLRPYYEIRIVREFVESGGWKKYGKSFTSCNRNLAHHGRTPTQGLWCGECAKCAFMFAMLSAFAPRKEVIEVFGKDLLADESLKDMYKDLSGEGDLKPFDCVGTFEETKTALGMEKHDELLQAQRAETVPHRWRFMGMKNALILGYGREGKVTEKFLRKFYPELQIGISDQKDGADYLDKQKDFDMAVRTPGIPARNMTGQYATATNIFFSRVSNITIGITGSKGKSTTVSLIYAMLKASGKDVQLLGNIGQPMLAALLETIPDNRIFILELSSAQLEDITFSPNVAAITNLFPEHMDYHGSVEAYYNAKRNICRWQKPGDVCLEAPFDAEIPVRDEEILLLGEHNRRNIRAAIAAAKYFEISNRAIAEAIRNFRGLPHRLEFVGEFRAIRFYDDAISTAPESTLEALKAVPDVGTIFLGGLDRGYDFGQLAEAVNKSDIKNVVLFPDSGAKIMPLLKNKNILSTNSMEEAVQFAYEKTEPGKSALLSTASPSYSGWANFEEQGNEFQHWVKTLG